MLLFIHPCSLFKNVNIIINLKAPYECLWRRCNAMSSGSSRSRCSSSQWCCRLQWNDSGAIAADAAAAAAQQCAVGNG